MSITMTNAEKLANIFTPLAGKSFTAKEIQAAFQAQYGESLSTSPSDFAGANPRSGVVYSDQVFDRSGSNYIARQEVIRKPRATRNTQTMADALASFQEKATQPEVV
jgi:hypothetical protein